jgi:polyferredoxin
LTATEALGKKVDAVTGATVTSSAVIASVRKRLGQLSWEDTSFRWSARGRVAEKAAAAAVLLFAFMSFIMPGPLRRYRWCLAVLSVLVLGFLNGCFLSLKLFYSWFVGGIPWTVSPVLVMAAVLAVGVPLCMGRNFYCAHVCPYGFAQELAGKPLGAFRKRTKKAGITKSAINTMRMIRRIFFAVIMIALLAGIHFHLDLVEPFSAFLFRSAPRFVLWLAGIFLLVSVFLPRFWCRCLCPTGQLLDIFSPRKGTTVSFPRKRESIDM